MCKSAVLKESVLYIAAIVICMGWLYWALQLWMADLNIPFNYGVDSIYFGTLVKGLIDNGWYTVNPHIGIPSAFNLYDFPFNCNLEFFIMKVLSLFNSNWAWVINVYFLLTFPLTIIAALFALRSLKIAPLPAIAGSLLFTFVPFHLSRGIGHINLQTIFLVPLLILMCFWIFEDEFLVNQFKKITRQHLAPAFHWKNMVSVIFCIAIASTFFYNSFFSCIFLCFTGLGAAIAHKRYTPLFNVLILCGLMSLIVILYNLPSLFYILEYGRNSEVIIRGPHESEIYGLKILQLLIPVTGHQIPFLAAIATQYATTAPLVNENRLAALGIIGSLGFLFLVIWVFYRLFSRNTSRSNCNTTKLDVLGGLNLAAVLLATVGGFGTIFAYMVVPWIRGLNRISVYIDFAAITAIILLVNMLVQNWSSSKGRQWFLSTCLVLITFIGLYDQTSTHVIPAYESVRTEYNNDRNFISTIQKTYPSADTVFQLPYVPFPEFGQLYKWRVYDHFRCYLHSKNIRWSYGTMQGRDGDLWQQYVSSKPLKEMLQELSLSGFNGIYLDGYGYADGGKEQVARISSLLGTQPITSANGRMFFFDMSPYNAAVKSQFPAGAVQEHMDLIKNLSSYEWLSKALTVDGKSIEATRLLCSSENTLYYIDMINGKPADNPAIVHSISYGQGRNIILTGWAVDKLNNTAAGGIYINIDGKKDIAAFYGQVRPDVGEYFKNTAYINTGFRAYLPSTLLGKGRHILSLKIISFDGQTCYKPAQRIIVEIK